ncbi:protein ASPARTIC PROTEASE IN GUARD CELL 1 [Syzygium oleosum]|uniref:protein ASPARTIC PROTEASE IN GUARD CELL 1 n=1 Tax=Syzygium oleosum TaxID=219896 RepID=UPI0011D20E83|nr:protein ASPARTIC PROTEASE IN GUARD CELL 1 [Syzygium oleosum]
MARPTSLSCLLFTLFSFSIALASSRTLSTIPTTTVLDVAASIHTTLNVFSLDRKTIPVDQQEEAQPSSPSSSSSSSLTLQLHSRATLQKPSQRDYRSLTLARLERDSARVKSLAARLDLAVSGVAKSDLKPLDASAEREIGAEGFESPVVSGTSQGSGEYFSRLGVGDPPSQVYMVIDTGSDVNWVQCAPCADCYQQADPIFEPASSSSFSPLACDTRQCRSLDVSECRNGSCLYQVSYGDGSYTVGDFVTETITLGSTRLRDVAIGCGHNNEGLFVGAAGLLGLGGGSLSFPSQLNASSFSYCLVDRDSDSASTLEFGSPLPPNAVAAPLIRNPHLDTFLYLGLTGISVGGDPLQLPEAAFQLGRDGSGGIIVDSGTAVTRLRSEVYGAVREAFARGTRGLPAAGGFALFDTCYDLSSKGSVEVPTVALRFGDGDGKEWALPAKNYMIPVDSNGTFCFAFAPTSSALSILGNVQQQGTRVGFDLRGSRIGFVPNKC